MGFRGVRETERLDCGEGPAEVQDDGVIFTTEVIVLS